MDHVQLASGQGGGGRDWLTAAEEVAGRVVKESPGLAVQIIAVTRARGCVVQDVAIVLATVPIT